MTQKSNSPAAKRTAPKAPSTHPATLPTSQRQTQASNLYRNVALLGASLALWGSSSRRVRSFFTLTGPLF
jgi:hypothetical protein